MDRSVVFRTRLLAVIVGVAVASTLALASPLLSSAAAPSPAAVDASAASTVLTTLNAARAAASPSHPSFDRNGYVADLAQLEAHNYADCGGCTSPVEGTLSALAGPTASVSRGYATASGGSVASRAPRVATDLIAYSGPVALGDNKYAAAGFVTKGSMSYAVLVTASFDYGIAMDEIRGGTVTLPKVLRVGVAATPVIKGFTPVEPSPVYDFEWSEDGTVIGTGPSYAPQASDLGQRIRVAVVYVLGGYSQASAAQATSSPVQLGTSHAGVWSVTGLRTVGSPLTAHYAGWGPGGVTLQWYRNGVAIPGETSTTYTQLPIDLGKRIDLRLKTSAPGYSTVVKKTAATTKTGPTSVSGTVPTITGSTVWGQTLTASAGAWGPAGVTLGYRWYSNSVAIPGATHSTLVLSKSVINTTITVRVTGTKAGYSSYTVSSAPSGDILRQSFGTTSLPAITGTVEKGSKVTATLEPWAPSATTYAYQWYVNGIAVKGASHNTFTVPTTATEVQVAVVGTRSYFVPVRVLSGLYAVN